MSLPEGEAFKNTWSNRVTGHCEKILIHLTKVTKYFKDKHRKLQHIN